MLGFIAQDQGHLPHFPLGSSVAGTRHPDPVALDTATEVTAVLVLLDARARVHTLD